MALNTNIFKSIFQSKFDTVFNSIFDYGYTYDFRDEFTTSLAAASVNGTSCEPGVGTRTVVDTETCLSILPNVGASLANQTGVTFGGSNNRCSYADGYAWMDFPTGFNAAAHAGQGRIVVMYDSNGRAAWGYLGAAGSGETLGTDLIAGWNFTSGWISSNATINDSDTFTTTNTYGGVRPTVAFFTVGLIYRLITVVDQPGTLWINNSTGITPLIGSGSGTFFITATNTSAPFIKHPTNSQSVNITYMDAKQVLTPSATGALIYRDAALTVNGWNKPTAFNMNSATYTFNIYQPTSGGKLFFMGGKATAAAGDPGEWLTTAITRTPGQILAFKVNPTDATKVLGVGASNAKTGTVVGNGLKIDTDLLKPLDSSTTGPGVFVPLDGVDYTLVCILRAAGAQFFIKSGTGVFKRVWSYTTNTTSTLYVAVTGNTLAGTVDFIRVPKTRWLPTPLLSDAFTAADATSNATRLSDGLGHSETTGLGSGGIATWSGASGAVQGNRLVITPTLGSDVLTDGGFENWDSATNLVSWTESVSGGSSINRDSSVKTVGNYSMRMDIDSSSNGSEILQNISYSLNAWYFCKFDYKVTSGNMKVMSNTTETIGAIYSTTLNVTNWTTKRVSGRNRNSDTILKFRRDSMTSASGWVDDVSLKLITLSTCFNTTTLSTTDIEIRTLFQMTTGTQCGIVMGLNEAGTSFILAYHDGSGNIKLEICENGTYTTKNTTAAIYVSDYELKVARRTQSNGTSEIWVWYNNVLIGAGPTTTLSSGESSNLSGLKAGLFSTYGESDTFATGDFSTDDFRNHYTGNSFNDAVIYSVGTNNEYQILDRLIGA